MYNSPLQSQRGPHHCLKSLAHPPRWGLPPSPPPPAPLSQVFLAPPLTAPSCCSLLDLGYTSRPCALCRQWFLQFCAPSFVQGALRAGAAREMWLRYLEQLWGPDAGADLSRGSGRGSQPERPDWGLGVAQLAALGAGRPGEAGGGPDALSQPAL